MANGSRRIRMWRERVLVSNQQLKFLRMVSAYLAYARARFCVIAVIFTFLGRDGLYR